MKVCSKCKVEKDEIEFCKSKRNIDGLCESCKKCSNERNAIYRANNREKIIESRDKFNRDHAEKIKEYSKKYASNNTEKIRKKQHEYYLTNSEKIKEKNKNWAVRNNEKLLERAKINRLKLSEVYVRRSISQGIFPTTIIPQSLVDFHREVIRAKRLLKELQK